MVSAGRCPARADTGRWLIAKRFFEYLPPFAVESCAKPWEAAVLSVPSRRARHELEHTMVDYAGPFGRISSTRDDSYKYSYLLCTLYKLHMLIQCRWYLCSHLLR